MTCCACVAQAEGAAEGISGMLHQQMFAEARVSDTKSLSVIFDHVVCPVSGRAALRTG